MDTTIQGFEKYTKKSKDRLITEISNNNINRIIVNIVKEENNN